MEWFDSFFAIFGLYRKPVPRQKRICQRCGKQIKNCDDTRDCHKKQIPNAEQQVLPFEGEGDI